MHPNEELARRELEAVESGDMAAVAGFYTEGLHPALPGPRSPRERRARRSLVTGA